MAFIRLEANERPRIGLQALAARLHFDSTVDDDHVGVFVDLVVTELLARFEADEDGSGVLGGVEDDWTSAAFGGLEVEQVPALHWR